MPYSGFTISSKDSPSHADQGKATPKFGDWSLPMFALVIPAGFWRESSPAPLWIPNGFPPPRG